MPGELGVEVEAELVRRLVGGDETALAALYRAYAPLVHGVALRVVVERVAAEDVVQQVFLHAWTHARDFDPDRARLRNWLAMLAHRRAVDCVRREAAHRRAASRVPDQVLDVEEAAIDSVVASRIRAAVAMLPEQHRAAIRMLYFEGLTVGQVADHLGVPEGTAKTRLRAARRQLAGTLDRERMVTAE